MSNPQTNYEVMQMWLKWLSSQPLAIGIGSIALFWIAMQLLNNRYAGGLFFERRFAWISSAIATVVAFIVFVVPNVPVELALSLVGIAILAGLTYVLRKYVH